MSTRCHVLVQVTGMGSDDSMLLYHHCDGYPSNMIPVLQKAWKIAVDESSDFHGKPTVPDWQAGRLGKVCGFLCAADPGQMEPLDYKDLHGDIEYLYLLHVTNSHSGSMAEHPSWEVEIYQPKSGRDWKEKLTLAKLELVYPKTDLTAMDGEKIEDSLREKADAELGL
jgi:hypothetical protein